MKAILVIDLPDDMRIKDIQVMNVTLYNGLYIREVTMNSHLKPLPELKNDRYGRDKYAMGWNDCLKEME